MKRHPSKSEGIPESVDDADSQAIDDPDAKKKLRSKRSTAARLEKLEDKHDDLVSTVTETRVLVGEISGKVDVIVGTLEQVTTIHTEKTVADVKIATVQKATEIQEQADKRKARRERITKFLGLVLSGGGIVELLHRLGIL